MDELTTFSCTGEVTGGDTFGSPYMPHRSKAFEWRAEICIGILYHVDMRLRVSVPWYISLVPMVLIVDLYVLYSACAITFVLQP
ncbi:hypothetical protein EV424DRAFT_1646775, partial [Suillus variegatus]